MSCCGLVLDAVVLIGLVMALNQDSDSPPFLKALAAAFAISLLTAISAIALIPLMGLWGLLVVIPAAAASAGLVLWLVFDVEPPRAAIGGVVFLVIKIVFAVAWQMLTATPT